MIASAEGVRQVIEFVVLLVAPIGGIAVLAFRNGRAHRRLAASEAEPGGEVVEHP